MHRCSLSAKGYTELRGNTNAACTSLRRDIHKYLARELQYTAIFMLCMKPNDLPLSDLIMPNIFFLKP